MHACLMQRRATRRFDLSRLRPDALPHLETLEVVNMPLPSGDDGGWCPRELSHTQV